METTQQRTGAAENQSVQGWLDRIECIRQRFPVSYRQARDVLERAGGDLIEALTMLDDQTEGEPAQSPPGGVWTDDTRARGAATARSDDEGGAGGFGERLRHSLQALWQDSTMTRLRVERGDHPVLDVPLIAGLAMGVFAPTLTLLSGLSALAADCRLSLGKPPPSPSRHLAKLTSAHRV